MSMHNKQPAVPSRHKSAVRNASSSYGNRPRSVGYYGSNTAPFTSSFSNSSPFSSLSNSKSLYGYNYQSPYFSNGYRTPSSSSSGYASLKIPAKAFQSASALDSAKDFIKGEAERRSRRDLSRGGSYYGRDRSLSRSRNSLAAGGLGSRSISLTSLNSEGYVVLGVVERSPSLPICS
ncbi:hypothetical protein NQ318_004792 [Aromia moschata]|uniref:Uncharacterized protein n=1 Tax=Aromia moschata TaxID=1265417 RepID=A0AAV8XTY5_9CUCU|nr:hypothetical protein NQ318_004792 [Aromia moschata]